MCLAVFSACETARLEDIGHHKHRRAAVDATLATALVMAQVPAVVAMPFSLQDDLSPIFTYHFYDAIAHGRTLEEALANRRTVVEGVTTTRAALELAQALHVELPITEQIARVLFEGRDVREAVRSLLGRDPKHELQGFGVEGQ